MTSTPIEIRELTVEAFRGVNHTTTLAFPGRLTLLLAPNGTGKTTVCNALEWLLTGQVKGIEERNLKCLTSVESAQPRVSAKIFVGDTSQRVERTRGQWKRGDSSSSLRKSAPGAFLEYLAPDTAMAETGKAATGIRQSWLRGTRFLAGHDLALLLDDEKDSIESRRRVFADLFGVEHIQASLRQIKRYKNEIGPEFNIIEKDVSRLEEEDKEYFSFVPPTSGADSSLTQAAETINFSIDNLEPNHAFDSLLAEVTRRGSMVEQQAEVLERVKAIFPQLSSLEKEKEELQKKIGSESATIKWLKSWLARVDKIKESAWYEESRLSGTGRDMEWHLKELEKVLRDEDVAPFLAKDINITGLREETEKRAYLFSEERLAKLDVLMKFVPDLLKAKFRVSELEATEEFSLGEPSNEEIDRSIAYHSELKRQQREISSNLDSLAGPIGELRTAGRTALNLLDGDTSDCPLCGHDWITAQALRSAVDQTLAGTTPVVQAMEKQLSQVKEQVHHQDRIVINVKQRASVYEEWRDKHGMIKKHLDDAHQLGLSDFPEKWEDEVKHARNLRHLYQKLDVISAVFKKVPFEVNSKLPVAKVLGLSHAKIKNELQEICSRRERVNETIDRAGRIQESIQQRLIHHDVSEVYKALAALDNRLCDLGRDWESLSGKKLTKPAIEEIESAIIGERRRLAEAKNYLDAAQVSLRHAEEARHAREARVRLNEKRQKAIQLREKLQLAENLSNRLSQHRDGYICEQLNDLMPTVRSLFSRVHANHVFDTILHGDKSDPLKWFAQIDGNRLSTDNFSQGQRQDLALAIFLARACSLGGTFFMDDPLFHLDDLNRVAVLDILRAIAISQPHVHLVITTASRPLARHLKEKFGRLDNSLLQVLELQGDPRSGKIAVEPMR
ncbi:hypothetical protein EBB56_00735 [Halomonas sp. YLB-10]|uniref:AAA family ATPase n=1 Tax=Halomonas sp. YLB-10 TaxID=2483111 RepID=UPI000F5EB91F|nr:AAA family ATPase [Halomonas sp. YLB-10]RQW72536.1 hypothetical protein EBB56_00735 [Halomonas sp. YLB-10]